MKKFYTFCLSAILTAGVAQAELRQFNANAFSGQLMSAEEVVKRLQNEGAVKAASKANEAPRTIKSQSATTYAFDQPSNAEALTTLSFDASYQGMIQSNAGAHEGAASFLYESNELYICLPDNEDQPLFVKYSRGTLTFPGETGYGQNQGMTIKLCVINANTGLPTGADVKAKFNKETGAFDIPATFAWGLCAFSGTELKGYYWAGSKFTLAISQGDFRINATLENECTTDNKFKFTINPGADAASVKAMVVPEDADPADYSEYIGQLGQAIEGGKTYTVDPVNNHVLVSTIGKMTESSYASVIFASFDTDGNIKKTQALPLIVNLETEEGWKDVATISYEDQLFAQYYQNFTHTQDAVLQAKADTDGIYRIVNPYSEYEAIHSADCNHYMILDITDPEWVSIPFSISGLNFGDGILTFGTCAALGWDKENATAKGMVSGTMVGQTVTFPIKSIFCHESGYDKPGSWSYFNATAPMTFTFPDITIDLTVVNADETPGANATVALGDKSVTTDAAGKATVAVPFETGYFGKAALKVNNEDVAINLNGAKTTYTYKIGTAGIENIEADANAVAEYYNLQGMKVETPAAGNLYIVKKGSKVYKAIYSQN